MSVVAVNCASRMKLGRGMNVTTTLFTTLSCEPMAQYTRMMPSTRVLRHSSVAAPFESSFAAAVSALVIGAIVACGAGAGLEGTRASSRRTRGDGRWSACASERVSNRASRMRFFRVMEGVTRHGRTSQCAISLAGKAEPLDCSSRFV